MHLFVYIFFNFKNFNYFYLSSPFTIARICETLAEANGTAEVNLQNYIMYLKYSYMTNSKKEINIHKGISLFLARASAALNVKRAGNENTLRGKAGPKNRNREVPAITCMTAYPLLVNQAFIGENP